MGEIESQLLTHENIKEAVVIDRESEEADKNEKYLCAYIVPDGAGEEIVKELSDYLSARLPDYMIPSFFVYLDKVPITPNGKIDRKMLPEPGIDIGEAYRAPRDEVEEKLVDIWADILGVEKSVISIDSNFFRLGGHSLKATGLVSRIHKALEVKLELSQVFKTPTIAKLAQAVKKSGKSIYKSIQPVEKNEYYPLSSAQNRMFMLNRIKDETDISDNTHGVMHVEGNLNRQRLENVVKQLIKRHEALRTSFELLDETPLQRVHKSVDSQVEYYDISNANPGEDRGDLIENIIQDFIRPFDLTKPPLMRVGLAKAAVNNYILIYDLHHIITDGGSGDIFVVEFMRLYGGGELPALKIQYKDFAVWQNNLLQPQVIRKQEEYWMSVFPGDIPVLNMPTDFPRPQVQSFAGDAVHFQVAGNLAKNINKLVTKTDTTLYIVLSAIFNVVLSKYTGQEDIVIGTAIAGRGHDDLENVIGFFVNTLAIRNYPKKEKSFTLFLEEVKDNSLKAYENQDYQFDQLVKKLDIKRDPGRHPLFDFYFLVHNENFRKKRSNRDIAALNFKPFGYEVKSTQFDIIIHAYEGSDVIDFDLLYCTDLFKPTTIEEFIADFKEVALSITQTPGTKLADIKISHGLYDKKLEFPKLDFGF